MQVVLSLAFVNGSTVVASLGTTCHAGGCRLDILVRGIQVLEAAWIRGRIVLQWFYTEAFYTAYPTTSAKHTGLVITGIRRSMMNPYIVKKLE